jgi:hypothetical protein
LTYQVIKFTFYMSDQVMAAGGCHGKLQSVAVSAHAAAGVDAARTTANAPTAGPAHGTQAAASWDGGSIRANEGVVEEFIQDVLDGHQEASGFFTPDATWSGGTAGTVTGGGLPTMLSPPPPLRQAHNELKPPAAFRIPASTIQLRHLRAAAIGHLHGQDRPPR